ncbi:MAG: barstar family protein [Gammaproteobacteria bacterium]|nr:barstar family protein [Gammaproteobacteria bacterium]
MSVSIPYRLQGSRINSLEKAYQEMAREMAFPPHFGHNLDALWDVLTTEVTGPFEIIWEDAKQSQKKMGKDYRRLLKLLKDLERTREDFRLKLK